MTEDVSNQGPLAHQTPVVGKWRWAILLGAFEVLMLTMGLLQTMGIYAVSLANEFKSSSAETGWIISSALAFLLAFGPLGSNSVKRFGCRKTAMLGCLLTSSGFIGGSFATSSLQLFICLGLVSGLGASLVYVSAVIVVGIHFHDKYSIANGIAFVGPGVGVFGFPPLLQLLIDQYGWRGSLLIQGGIALNILTGAALFRPLQVRRGSCVSGTSGAAAGQVITDTKLPHLSVTFNKNYDNSSERREYVLISTHNTQCEVQSTFTTEAVALEEAAAQSLTGSYSLAPDQRHSFDSANVSRNSFQRSSGALSVAHSELPEEGIIDSSVYRCGQRVKRSLLMDKPAVLLICAVDFMLSFAHMAVLVHIVPHAQALHARHDSNGTDKQAAALVLSVIGIGSIVTRISHGWLIDKRIISPLGLDAFALAISAGACIFNPLTGTYIGVMFSALVVGLSSGIYYPIVPVVLKDLVGLSKMTTAYGMALFCDGLGMVAGGYFVGLLRDATGSYDSSFYFIGCVYALASGTLTSVPVLQYYKEYRQSREPASSPQLDNDDCKPKGV